MNLDGTEAVSLTPATESSFDFDPQWSPDRSRIVFSATRTGGADVYVMNADGDGRYPAWSPDGTKIVFASDRDGSFEIYTMNADGSGATKLTANPGFINSDPCWTSDGSEIVFASTRDANPEIYVMSADGTNQRRVTTDPSFDAGPDAG